MKQHNPTLPELLDLIERYFDCSLSDPEEEQLRSIIARTTLSHPAIDEARALMGFRLPSSAASKASGQSNVLPADSLPARSRKRLSLRAAISIAAAIAVIFAIGLHLSLNAPLRGAAQTQCIAYANGERITDEADVIRLLTEDLREFNDGVEEADRNLNDELNIIAPVIEDYESPMPMLEI